MPDLRLHHQRAILRASRDDVGIWLLDSESVYLNSICNCAPQFIDRKDELGNLNSKGLFLKLSSVLHEGAIDVGKEEQRSTTYLKSGSSNAQQFSLTSKSEKNSETISILFYPQINKLNLNTTSYCCNRRLCFWSTQSVQTNVGSTSESDIRRHM